MRVLVKTNFVHKYCEKERETQQMLHPRRAKHILKTVFCG